MGLRAGDLRFRPAVQRLVSTGPNDDSTLQVIGQHWRQIEQLAGQRCLLFDFLQGQLRLAGLLALSAAVEQCTGAVGQAGVTAALCELGSTNNKARLILESAK